MYSIIANPLSGGGLASQKLPELEKLLREKGIAYRMDITRKAGEARALARKAAEDGLEGVIAMGGDGTFYEVANGLGESGLELIFAPCGTGNDFMRMFHLSADTVEAVKKQMESPVRMLDLCKCNDGYYLNIAGTGFDVEVLIQAERFKAKYSGLGAYLRGAYYAIRHLKPLKAQVTIDGGVEQERECTILSVGNGRYLGGGMKAVPGAVVDDGLLDVVMCRPVSKISLIWLLLLFVRGRHVKYPSLTQTLRCRKIRVVSPGMTIEADGEMFPCDEAVFEVLPGGLRTRLPK